MGLGSEGAEVKRKEVGVGRVGKGVGKEKV